MRLDQYRTAVNEVMELGRVSQTEGYRLLGPREGCRQMTLTRTDLELEG